MSRDQIALRLKEMRQRIGFTQGQVAAQLNLHRPTISEIEAGRRAVSAEELFDLAKLYGTSIGELLSEEQPLADSAPELLALRAADATAPACRAAIIGFIGDRKSEVELEEMLQVTPNNATRRSFRLAEPRSKGDAITQGSWLARQERQALGLGTAPVRNVLALLASQGVRIGPIRTLDDDAIDGLYFESADLGACVGINWRSKDLTGGRAAFTAAHEYAHCLLMDRQRELFSFANREPDLQEMRANSFAAAFLMPEEVVTTYFEQVGLCVNKNIDHLAPGDVVRAMDFFGVSRSALLFRLRNLLLITEALAESLSTFGIQKIAKALGLTFRHREYLSTRLPQLAIHAWRQGLITTGRAASLCDLDIVAFKDRMQTLGEAPDEYVLPVSNAVAS